MNDRSPTTPPDWASDGGRGDDAAIATSVERDAATVGQAAFEEPHAPQGRVIDRFAMPRARAIPLNASATDPQGDPEDGLLALIRAVIIAAARNKLVLVAWMALCVGLAAFYLHVTIPTYTATAMLLLEPRRQSPVLERDAPYALVLDSNRAESELQVIKSERLLTKVFDDLQLASDPEFASASPGLVAQLRAGIEDALGTAPERVPNALEANQIAFMTLADRVGVRRVGQSYVVEVSCTMSSPALARRVANSIVSAYLWQSIALKSDAALNGAEFLQWRLNALTTQAKAAAAAIAAGALPDTPTPDADARVIGAALQPLRQSAPRPGLIIALGGISGLIAGALTIMFGYALNRRIRTPDEVARATGLPCLAVVPEAGRWNRPFWTSERESRALVRSRPESAFALAIRDLRTSLLLGLPGQPDRNCVVALVAWKPASGCTMLGSNLAHVLREGGKPVTIIDADVRPQQKGTASERPPATASLAELLTQPAPIETLAPLVEDGLAVIPGSSRNPRTNVLAYLGAPGMSQIVGRAREDGHVVIDLPSLSTTADARAAAVYADAVVIVAVAGRTTGADLVAARQALQGVGANVVGVVINRAKPA